MSEDAFFQFLRKRKNILEGVCVTGGEPLLNKDISHFLEKIKAEGYLVKLDTNGSFPDALKHLVKRNLVDYVAMDIKNAKEQYPKTIGTQHIDIHKIEESIAFLMENTVDYEFRTTAVKGIHTIEDFESIGNWIRSESKYFIQNYIDTEHTIASIRGDGIELAGFTEDEIEEFVAISRKYGLIAQKRGI